MTEMRENLRLQQCVSWENVVIESVERLRPLIVHLFVVVTCVREEDRGRMMADWRGGEVGEGYVRSMSSETLQRADKEGRLNMRANASRKLTCWPRKLQTLRETRRERRWNVDAMQWRRVREGDRNQCP